MGRAGRDLLAALTAIEEIRANVGALRAEWDEVRRGLAEGKAPAPAPEASPSAVTQGQAAELDLEARKRELDEAARALAEERQELQTVRREIENERNDLAEKRQEMLEEWRQLDEKRSASLDPAPADPTLEQRAVEQRAAEERMRFDQERRMFAEERARVQDERRVWAEEQLRWLAAHDESDGKIAKLELDLAAAHKEIARLQARAKDLEEHPSVMGALAAIEPTPTPSNNGHAEEVAQLERERQAAMERERQATTELARLTTWLDTTRQRAETAELELANARQKLDALRQELKHKGGAHHDEPVELGDDDIELLSDDELDQLMAIIKP